METRTHINSGIYKIKGKVQNYDWGGKSFIPNLIKKKNSTDNNFAEYWLGAHAKAPSIIDTEKGSMNLDLFLNENPTENLGLKVANSFKKLPFLFKVLDVHKMLSIQVHPTKEAAKIGFELENEKGILLTDSNRNYKDKNHKPEVMVALGDFWLLHGFLERSKIIKNLSETKELNFLLPVFLEEGYLELYKKVMQFTQEEVNVILKPLVKRILPKFLNDGIEKSSPEYWAAKAIQNNNFDTIDRGIFSIYFFNILNLSKGEAIFQDAGVPHAYLEGKNIELMANSDNVLRGGLTTKHIDVDELLKHTKFEETIPKILKGTSSKDNGETVYKTTADDFELSKIDLEKTVKHNSISNSVEILLLLKGSATVTQNDEITHLEKGQSVFIRPNTAYKIETETTVEIYKASVPES
ncbi:mannose-6-phosphate isomerase, class I [uncultured Polaribacter sp.]|uniref:mannose-6-phosphate isomerase, class I n=1 Tax=uncultured Polaribacter sp. TaxID=174711 RepID=UPI00262F9371|nr:mannose-6-phosphate isomerase, class I [uncultured Polaribacter sp.]